MRVKRTGATIVAGLLTGAAALGFGLGTAGADPVEWVDDAETTATLSLGDEPGSETLPGEFEGLVDDDAGTITGDVEHPEFAFPIDNPIGDDPEEIDLSVQLLINDIDLDWDQDDGSVTGTAGLELNLLEALGIDLTEGGCSALAPIDLTGSYDDEGPELQFGGEIGGIELEGECAGLAGIIGPMLGDITGDIETIIGEAPEDPEDPEEPTTTTEAPDNGDNGGNGGGATPVPGKPNYTG